MMTRREGKWKPPGKGMLKCNFDAVVPTHGAFICFGFIVCNSRGGVIMPRNGRHDGASKALAVESLGCRKAF